MPFQLGKNKRASNLVKNYWPRVTSPNFLSAILGVHLLRPMRVVDQPEKLPEPN